MALLSTLAFVLACTAPTASAVWKKSGRPQPVAKTAGVPKTATHLSHLLHSSKQSQFTDVVSLLSSQVLLEPESVEELNKALEAIIVEIEGNAVTDQSAINTAVANFQACGNLPVNDTTTHAAMVTAAANIAPHQFAFDASASGTVSYNFGDSSESGASGAAAAKGVITQKLGLFNSALSTLNAAKSKHDLATQAHLDANAALIAAKHQCYCDKHSTKTALDAVVKPEDEIRATNLKHFKMIECVMTAFANGAKEDSAFSNCTSGPVDISSVTIDYQESSMTLPQGVECTESESNSQQSSGDNRPAGVWSQFKQTTSHALLHQRDVCKFKKDGAWENGGQCYYEYVNAGQKTWTECMLFAAEVGGTLCSEDYTTTGGWYAHLDNPGAQYMEEFYTYTTAPVTETNLCIVGRVEQATGNVVPGMLPETGTHNGHTWKYADLGSLYYNECALAASQAGASITDPSVIGGDSTSYWSAVGHSGNVYTYYTGANTYSHDNVDCNNRGSQQKCMIGFMSA